MASHSFHRCLLPALLLAAMLLGGLPRRANAQHWQLAWSDEFDDTGLPDEAKWGYEEGFIRNRELQYYTRGRKENCWVDGGVLTLRARREQFPNPRFREGASADDWKGSRKTAEYTSASLTTRDTATWRYGRIEVRAKLPSGRGVWPAIWMLGAPKARMGWPACGEIDIMEYVGFQPDTIHANVHTAKYNHKKGNNKGAKITVERPYGAFHVYAIEWSGEKIDFFVDERKYFTYENEGTGPDAWPFDWPHYLILNIAVGGSWGGQKGVDEEIFPQTMEIDYVRVYKRSDSP